MPFLLLQMIYIRHFANTLYSIKDESHNCNSFVSKNCLLCGIFIVWAGVLHMLFNVFALLFVGKVVEKKIGSLRYFLLYHVIAVVNAIIMCFIFAESVSVGASAGIFGMIGIVCVMKWKKDDICTEILKKKEMIYIILFSLLSLILGLESFATHFVAFVLGIISGLLL